MKPRVLPVLQKLKGWRLAAIVSVCTVIVAEIIVSIMDVLLKGEVTADYLLTGFVAAGIVAPTAIAVLTYLLQELARQQEDALTNAVDRVEARLKVALESTDEGILMVARDGKVLSANQRFLDLWQVPMELAATGRDEQLLAHVLGQLADPEQFMAKVRQLYGSREEASDTLDFRDGRVFARYTRVLSLGDEDGRIWCFKDITEQARTQAALAEREEIFRTIVTQANDAITMIDTETLRFVEFNAAACEGLGYTHEEFARLEVTDIQAEMDADTLRRRLPPVVGSGVRNFETLHRHKDGSLRNVLVSLKAIELRGKTLLVGTWSDITENKRSESAVAESRNLLQTVIDTAPVRVFWKDRDLRYLGCNPAFATDAGKASPHEVIGRDDHEMAWSEQADLYRADDRAVMESGVAKLFYEEPQTTPGGQHIWLRTSKVPLRGEGGAVIGVLGIYEDITERKRAERNLTMAVEVTAVVFWELDFANHRLMFDRTRLPVLGLEPEPVLETLQGWLEKVHPDDRENFQRRFEFAMRPGDPPFDFEYRMVGVAGRQQWIHTRGRVVQRGAAGQPELAVGTSTNITARKQIEEAVRASEEHSRNLAAMLRLMCDNVPDMIWAKDLDKRYLFANKAFCAQLLNAVDTDEPLGKTDMFFARRERDSHRNDPNWHTFGELCQDSDAVTLERGVPSVFEEFGNVKGRLVYLDVHKAPFLNEKGEVIGTVGSARDITERKLIEAELARHRQHLEGLVQERTEALLATEARASHILQSAADGLYGVDVDGRITFVNPAACQMLGYTAEQMVGRSAHELFHSRRGDGTPYPKEECPTHDAVRDGREVRVDHEVFWRADGRVIPVMYAVHPMLRDGRNVGAVISFVDMTAQRAAAEAREQALLAAENLARVRSEFLANMSHEIRTPLNGVLGFAAIGLRNSGENAKARNAFEKILSSGGLLLGVVNEILD
ncbi:MAG: PAS domain S-box protein, partial [Rhodocyclaceae bacterium]|nr:PAS domain S-box protein [Rhodocyclaceae bacterium]